jgi:hypothetical protein
MTGVARWQAPHHGDREEEERGRVEKRAEVVVGRGGERTESMVCLSMRERERDDLCSGLWFARNIVYLPNALSFSLVHSLCFSPSRASARCLLTSYLVYALRLAKSRTRAHSLVRMQ